MSIRKDWANWNNTFDNWKNDIFSSLWNEIPGGLAGPYGPITRHKKMPDLFPLFSQNQGALTTMQNNAGYPEAIKSDPGTLYVSDLLTIDVGGPWVLTDVDAMYTVQTKVKTRYLLHYTYEYFMSFQLYGRIMPRLCLDGTITNVPEGKEDETRIGGETKQGDYEGWVNGDKKEGTSRFWNKLLDSGIIRLDIKINLDKPPKPDPTSGFDLQDTEGAIPNYTSTGEGAPTTDDFTITGAFAKYKAGQLLVKSKYNGWVPLLTNILHSPGEFLYSSHRGGTFDPNGSYLLVDYTIWDKYKSVADGQIFRLDINYRQ